MQLVIQFQSFYNKMNMLTRKYNKKMNKRNRGITDVKKLHLFYQIYHLDTYHLNLLPELDDENSAFRYYQTSQSRRKKGFNIFFVIFGVR